MKENVHEMELWKLILLLLVVWAWIWIASVFVPMPNKECKQSKETTQILERLDSIEMAQADYAQQVDALDK